MLARIRYTLVSFALLVLAGLLTAQPTPIPPPKETPKADPTPPPRDQVAARVNGQAIYELAVYRGLMRVPAQRREEARKEVLNYLIDNTIVDQYLLQLKIPVEPKEVDEHIEKAKKEAANEKQEFSKLLQKLMITEEELRSELTSALRWDKFILQQGTDKVLQEYFKGNIEMFNGSRMHAKHILIPSGPMAQATIQGIKKKIEDEVSQNLAKLPATTDAITREKERVKVLDATFAKAAADHSTCPSKKDGGNLGLFPRAGAMVEPFARAAFALKPYQMSDPVSTEFGYHLILAVDYKPGKEVKFEDVKPFVQEVYSERLREAVLGTYRTKSKIEFVEKK